MKFPTKQQFEQELRRQIDNASEQLRRYLDLFDDMEERDADDPVEQIALANLCRHTALCAVVSNLDAVWREWGPNT